MHFSMRSCNLYMLLRQKFGKLSLELNDGAGLSSTILSSSKLSVSKWYEIHVNWNEHQICLNVTSHSLVACSFAVNRGLTKNRGDWVWTKSRRLRNSFLRPEYAVQMPLSISAYKAGCMHTATQNLR
eukprot:TRINITY_DN9970_c0_g1_i2.p2 TRINITY_DN9970_c0_g1~~TRINITY_DN9970_c0_g1_i2.p2  ORF type:complete len:127 (+),score=6.19 TRINITY_DN9970_c0_g1_i2:257-637(+)